MNAVKSGGAKVFQPMQAEGGQQLYLSHVPGITSASVWFLVQPPTVVGSSDQGEKKHKNAVHLGMYSATAGVSTHNAWSITAPESLGPATIFALIVESITWNRMTPFVARVGQRVFERLVRRWGIRVSSWWARVARVVVRAGPAAVAFAAWEISAAIAFRSYAIVYNIYNFDDRPWHLEEVHLDNAGQVGEEAPSLKGITLPPRFKAGEADPSAPAGWEGVKSLKTTATLLPFALQNKRTFFEGLGIGLILRRDDGASMTVKFKLPRAGSCTSGIDNSVAGSDALTKFYKEGSWSDNKEASVVQTKVGAVKVSTSWTQTEWEGTSDAYKVVVNIGDVSSASS